jgi:putative hydrolase of the HAD superfamily
VKRRGHAARRTLLRRAADRRAIRAPAARKPHAQLRIWPVAVEAVIFDWGGTLTPWHSIDQAELWSSVCAPHFPAAQAAAAAAALRAAESELWQLSSAEQRSATISALFELAGVAATEAFMASYTRAWEPHTCTDPDAPELLSYLRGRGIKVGVLSNTMWPRGWHEEVFSRDGVLELIDGAVYTSEIDRTKPHPQAFRAAMTAVGVADPAGCVFVGDRPYEDVYGAKRAGMRAVLIPNSDVPPFGDAVPDAVIGRLAELRPIIESWRDGAGDRPQNGPARSTMRM